MKKHYLLAPGPTPVSPETLLSMATPIIHHRSPQFAEVVAECREGLKYLFQTKQEVLILASTGTGAMEGSITNTLSPGDTALVVRGGKFGERWGEICDAFGVKFEAIDVPWGTAVKVADIAAKLKANPAIKAVCVQAHETSTGVNHPVQEIAAITRNLPGTLLIVDAISALGAFELPMDEWGIDILVAGSQKAMMLPPGLAFASLSDKAWGFTKTAKCSKYYFNFSKELKNVQKNTGAYTSAVSLVMGLRDVLRYFKATGLEKIFAEHKLMSKATKAAVKALGLELFSKEGATDALTAVKAPAGVDGQDVVKTLREKYGIMIAGGQAEAKGKIFRIAHMGYIGNFDIIMIVAALEVVLNELGYKAPYGAGVKAAEEVLFGGA
jgi:serine---pyruvate transaminase